MTQPSLLDAVIRSDRPRKRVRQTSRAVYAEQRAKDAAKAEAGHETREGQVLRLLARYMCCNVFESPTALELLGWAHAHGEKLFDINSIRPRITELVSVGLVESAGKRRCRVSGKTVHTWRVRSR